MPSGAQGNTQSAAYKRIVNVSRNFQFKAALNKDTREWTFQHRSSGTALYSAIASLGDPSSPWDALYVASPGPVQISEGNDHTVETKIDEAAVVHRSSSIVISPEDQEIFLKKATEYYRKKNIEADIVPVWGKVQRVPQAKSSSATITPSVSNKLSTAYQSIKSEALKDGPMYADSVLWDVLHYRIPTLDGYQQHNLWKNFTRWSQYFADNIVSNYRPGDLILIHDYSLFLLPRLIRKQLPDAPIVFFLHAPFCTSEVFRCLSKRAEILKGVLASNVIAMQTDSYTRHFLSTCSNVLGLETTSTHIDTSDGFRVVVFSSHVSIDVPRVYSRCNSKPVSLKIQQLKSLYPSDKKLIVGRDQLTKACGVTHKLRAFRELLTHFPKWRGHVVLIQITSLPVGNNYSNEELKKTENLVAQINSEFGSLDYTPVIHFHQLLDPDEYYALLSVANIACVSSVRDSMNTMALEYVACQQKNKGSLILSEFSGTAELLLSAYLVNPYDYSRFAETINYCLNMTEKERERRFSSLWKQATSQSSQQWIYKLINRAAYEVKALESHMTTPLLTYNILIKPYRNAKRRLFLLDYDGTLIESARNSIDAVPTDRLLRTLKRLASDSRNIVWILSGRSQKFMEEWMGDISELGLSSEHGSAIRPPLAGSWSSCAENLDLSWKDTVRDFFQYYVERTPGSYIEEKKHSISWCYQNANTTYSKFQSLECQTNLEDMLKHYDVEISPAKSFLEVHPNYLNKGSIVRRILKRSGSVDFVFCAGDDKTDENMFEVFLPTAFSNSHLIDEIDSTEYSGSHHTDDNSDANKVENVKVATFRVHIGLTDKPTLSDYHLPAPRDLGELLHNL